MKDIEDLPIEVVREGNKLTYTYQFDLDQPLDRAIFELMSDFLLKASRVVVMDDGDDGGKVSVH